MDVKRPIEFYRITFSMTEQYLFVPFLFFLKLRYNRHNTSFSCRTQLFGVCTYCKITTTINFINIHHLCLFIFSKLTLRTKNPFLKMTFKAM